MGQVREAPASHPEKKKANIDLDNVRMWASVCSVFFVLYSSDHTDHKPVAADHKAAGFK